MYKISSKVDGNSQVEDSDTNLTENSRGRQKVMKREENTEEGWRKCNENKEMKMRTGGEVKENKVKE